MMNHLYNIVVLEVSCFEGMAGSKRVRNLIDPLIKNELIKVNNLIFHSANKEPMEKDGIVHNIKFKIIGYRLSNIFYFCKFFVSGFLFLMNNKLLKHTNIIYNYGGPNIKNISFIFFAKLIGYKIICDFTEDTRYEPNLGYLNKFKTKSSLFLLEYVEYIADYAIGISDHLCKRLLHLSNGKVPVDLIPICVNFDYFTNDNNDHCDNDIKIFYGGSFNEKDGLYYLIHAFDKVSQKYSNIQLILSGYAIESDLYRVKTIIRDVVAKDKISYKGFLSTDEYYKLLNECDIFCMTRINSNYANAGFPFKLGEFLATGKPVIATTVGEISKYLINNVNAILIAPNSIDELVQAISELLENPRKFTSIGLSGKQTAEDNFDSNKISMKLFSIFQSF